MERRRLGRSGLEVTGLAFGAWGIGSKHYGAVEERDAFSALEAYVDGGGNFIDTARGYHLSEAIVGRFLRKADRRERVVLATKVAPVEPTAIRKDFDESRRQLQADVIDLLFLHQPPEDPDTMNRVLDVYAALKDRGQIRAIGASVKGANVSQATVDLCRQYIRTRRVDALMVIFSILRQKTREVFDEAASAGVGIVLRTVLENGFLTGKYHPGHRFPGGFPNGDHRSRWNGPKLDRILDWADEVARTAVKPPYATLAQVAIRFALDEPVSSVSVGAKDAAQSAANLVAASLPPLPSDIRKKLVREYAGRETEVNLD